MPCHNDRKRQNKPVIMLPTFCGAFDVPHHKKEDKVVPATAVMAGNDTF